MRIRVRFGAVLSVALLGTGGLLAEGGTGSVPSLQSDAESGFYEGIILLSGGGGSLFDRSGDLIRTESSQWQERRTQAALGAAEVRVLGTVPASPLLLLPARFSSESSATGVLEYGISSQIGAGISIARTSIHVQRQEQFLLPNASSSSALFLSRYTEVTPVSRRFYRDTIWMAHFSWHPVEKTRIDPYLLLRGGLLKFESAFQSSTTFIAFNQVQSQNGTGFAGALGVGANLYLTPEFGVKIEGAWTRRLLRGDGGFHSALNTTALEAGFVLNFDNIARYSY
ncbi:MAG: hypothetical protein K1X75_01035 [Leptospirales bacterium]|nr:hypothetical protein [Leptospirales bacterium]